MRTLNTSQKQDQIKTQDFQNVSFFVYRVKRALTWCTVNAGLNKPCGLELDYNKIVLRAKLL